MERVVYCRFRSQKKGSALPIDGPAVSLRDLKKAVFRAYHLYKALDYDLTVWDATTEKEYEDEDGWILAGSSVVMARVPLPTRKMKGRVWFEREIPHPGYTCRRCNLPGHTVQFCRTNGDPDFDHRKLKTPRGIPRSRLVENPDGAYALSAGVAAVVQPDEAAFEREMEGLPSTRPAIVLPPEWNCPLCNKGMRDAVFTSKCCFKSFCDGCIRGYTITNSMCVCGERNVLADHLLPNKTLREAISRMLEYPGTSSSGSSGISSTSTFSASSTSTGESKQHLAPPVKCSSDPIKKVEAPAKRPPPVLDSEQGNQKKRKQSTDHSQPSGYDCYQRGWMPYTMPLGCTSVVPPRWHVENFRSVV